MGMERGEGSETGSEVRGQRIVGISDCGMRVAERMAHSEKTLEKARKARRRLEVRDQTSEVGKQPITYNV